MILHWKIYQTYLYKRKENWSQTLDNIHTPTKQYHLKTEVVETEEVPVSEDEKVDTGEAVEEENDMGSSSSASGTDQNEDNKWWKFWSNWSTQMFVNIISNKYNFLKSWF